MFSENILAESSYQNVLTKLVPWGQSLYFIFVSGPRNAELNVSIKDKKYKCKNKDTEEVAYNLLTDVLGAGFSHSEQSVAQ